MKAKTTTTQTTGTELKKAVSYYRVSTEIQFIDRQKSDITEYCNYKHYDLIREFSEVESGKVKVRPVLTEMLDFCKNNHIDIICISELSRLGRSNEILNTIELLNGLGINLYSLKENINTLDSDGSVNANAALLTSVMSGINQFELTTLKYRLKSGYKERYKNGGCNSSDIQPMGYKKVDKKIVIDEEESQLIERIFNMYVNGNKGVSQIRRILNAENIPSKRGKQFKDYTITHMLRNTIYIGQRRFKGEVFELPELQIVETSLFNQAQNILDTHNKKMNMGKKHNYLLDNKLIKCGVCGKSFFAHMSNPHSTTGNGNMYKCLSKKYNEPCDNYGIQITKLENAVIKNIEKYFPLDVVSQLDKQFFLDEIQAKKSLILDYDLQLKGYQGQLERIQEVYIDGGMTKVKYMEKKQAIELKQLNDQLKQTTLNSDITNLEYQSNIPEYSELNRDVLQKLLQGITISPAPELKPQLKQKNDKALRIELTIMGKSLSFYLSHYSNMNEVINNTEAMTA